MALAQCREDERNQDDNLRYWYVPRGNLQTTCLELCRVCRGSVAVKATIALMTPRSLWCFASSRPTLPVEWPPLPRVPRVRVNVLNWTLSTERLWEDVAMELLEEMDTEHTGALVSNVDDPRAARILWPPKLKLKTLVVNSVTDTSEEDRDVGASAFHHGRPLFHALLQPADSLGTVAGRPLSSVGA